MTSRYAGASTLTLSDPDGRQVTYLGRRFLAVPPRSAVGRGYVVRPGQRVDLLAAATLGDPELSWQLADANAVARPSDLERPGELVQVPTTAGSGFFDAR